MSTIVYFTMFRSSKKEKKDEKQNNKKKKRKIAPLPPKISEKEFVEESEKAADSFIQSMIDQVRKIIDHVLDQVCSF